MTTSETTDHDKTTTLTQADSPCDFGRKASWLAFQTTNSHAVITALALTDIRASDWKHGIRSACGLGYKPGIVFVTPPIKGWTLVVGGVAYLHTTGDGDHCTPILLKLGNTFSDIQYFGSDRQVDFSAWARVVNGDMVRAYSYMADTGLMINAGLATPEERALGFGKFGDDQTEPLRFRRRGRSCVVSPSEDDVLNLAGQWSINPTLLSSLELEPSLGWVGMWPGFDSEELDISVMLKRIKVYKALVKDWTSRREVRAGKSSTGI